MRYIVAALALSIATHAHALSLSQKDKAFIGGALTGYAVASILQNKSGEDHDPCWRGGWDDGTPCYPQQVQRYRNMDFCPSPRFCNDEYRHPNERAACLRGIAECRRDAEQLDWGSRADEAYLRGLGRR
jgi:hypothetical protein